LHLPSRSISDAEFLFILRSMPAAGGCYALITRLTLDANKISSINHVPWPLSLTHISLSHNLLTSVAGDLLPPHLRCLHLDSNAIQSVSASSSPLLNSWPSHLTVLDLGRNMLSGCACVRARRFVAS
jgi:Leucine-rich repeat (LRR) protein